MTWALEFEDFSHSYPDGRQALKNITLRIAQGEKAALVGPNGAGKSTLLLQTNGILRGRGGLRVCGLELSKENLGRVRALVGLVFQSPDDQLFSPTVFEDVAYGPIYQGLAADEVQTRVREALATVQMAGFEQRVSYHLSVGEKKRIALAAVLSMQPAILALDEPSAGLDPRARRSLIGLLQTLPQTLIIASHDLALVGRLAQRVVILDEGRIIADGPAAEILADKALLEAHGLD